MNDMDQCRPLKHLKTKSNITRKKVPTCKLDDFFDLPGEMTYLITLKLIHFASTSIFYWASTGEKMYADKCSHLFWECLAEDISLGICEHSLFGITGPANLLFRLDKVLHRSTSALISNSPFLTFTLVSSGGKKECTWNRVGERQRE